MASVSASTYCQTTATMERNSLKVALEDCICPICMCILIEPVTMPCQHELCMPCFKQNVEEANLTCPMCRIRISVWARKAGRNHTLVNETRWQQIKQLFPDKVHRRLEGKDDDGDEVFSIPKPQLAEPGEIRKEYEEQLRKMREAHAAQRRLELEASEALVRQLQEEEDRKAAQRWTELKALENHDHELAQELSQVFNEAGTDNPINLLMQESESRLTRSSSANSTKDQASTIESFLERLKGKSTTREGVDPYPFACLTPSDKDAGPSTKPESSSDKGLFSDNDSQRPQTVTISSSHSNASLQDMFSPISVINLASERSSVSSYASGRNSLHTSADGSCMSTVGPENSSAAKSKNAKQTISKAYTVYRKSTKPQAASSSTSADNQLGQSSNLGEECSLTESSKDTDRLKSRCHSTESNDSISQEISHFKPIQMCPRTPPRVLPNGKVLDPPVVRTTPRNLSRTALNSGDESAVGLNFDPGSPIMQRRLEALAKDRKRQVEARSKSTSTMVPALSQPTHFTFSNLKPNLNKHQHRMINNLHASSTVSSERQLDVNFNEQGHCSTASPEPSSYRISHHHLKWNGFSLDGLNGICNDYGNGDSVDKPVLPLVSHIDDMMDELDGSPPLPQMSELVQNSGSPSRPPVSDLAQKTEVPSPSFSRRHFFSQESVKHEKSMSISTERLTPVNITTKTTKGKGKRKLQKKRHYSGVKSPLSPPQTALKDMFARAQNIKKEIGLSPCFGSACSTPLNDEGTVQMKSLINQAISCLERDDTLHAPSPLPSVELVNAHSLDKSNFSMAEVNKSFSCSFVVDCANTSDAMEDTKEKSVSATCLYNSKACSSSDLNSRRRKRSKSKKTKWKKFDGSPTSSSTLDKFMVKLDPLSHTCQPTGAEGMSQKNVAKKTSKLVNKCQKRRKKIDSDSEYEPSDNDCAISKRKTGKHMIIDLSPPSDDSDSDFDTRKKSRPKSNAGKFVARGRVVKTQVKHKINELDDSDYAPSANEEREQEDSFLELGEQVKVVTNRTRSKSTKDSVKRKVNTVPCLHASEISPKKPVNCFDSCAGERRLSGRKKRRRVYLYEDDVTDQESGDDVVENSQSSQRRAGVQNGSGMTGTFSVRIKGRPALPGRTREKPATVMTVDCFHPPVLESDSEAEDKIDAIRKNYTKRSTRTDVITVPQKRNTTSNPSDVRDGTSRNCTDGKSCGESKPVQPACKGKGKKARRSAPASVGHTKLDSWLSPNGKVNTSRLNHSHLSSTAPVQTFKTQEDLDMQLALKLQKQFELDARLGINVDRRKGSTDEYSFRRRDKKSASTFSPIASHTRRHKSTL